MRYLLRQYADYRRTHRCFRRKRHDGAFTYTVISAARNAEKYLDGYFASLTEQLLDFTTHIRVVLVDDGSTDASAAVIRKWQARYPRNIVCLHKENGVHEPARDRGFPLVATPWVTFIDPGDFVDVAYFSQVDDVLRRHHRDDPPDARIQILCCNVIPYHELTGRFGEELYPRSLFLEEERLFPYTEMDDFLPLSVGSAFFRTAEIERQAIRFGECRWPDFAGTHFLARYLQGLDAGRVALTRAPRHYSGTCEGADFGRHSAGWAAGRAAGRDKRRYLDQPRETVLALLEESASGHGGQAPVYVQRMALQHLFPHCKNGMNAPAPPCLGGDEVARHIALLRRCATYIAPEVVLSLRRFFPAASQAHVAAMLGWRKNAPLTENRASVTRYDAVRRQICLEYYAQRPGTEQVEQGGEACAITHAKTATHTFLGEPCCLQRRLWVTPVSEAPLELRLDGAPARLVLGSVSYPSLAVAHIREYFAPPPPPRFARSYARAWVLADRDTQADDNAEHLYRFIRRRHPEREAYFALRDTSHDWARLKREGFALLRIGGGKYARVMRGCSMVISSHLAKYMVEHAARKPYVFLTHGVCKDNIANWLNPKKIDLVLAATEPEYASIVSDGSPYILSSREVRLTGFPRHDALVPHIGRHENLLLVMPTWRRDLLGPLLNGRTQKRRLLADFMDSAYARCWKSFLSSEALRRMAQEKGTRIVFFPHADMQGYLPHFPLPEHIESVSHADASIQNLLKQAVILVTDYSSVAFEMAYMKKAVLYYQFDRESIFSGGHITLQGDFDYLRDGFGPVARDEDALLRELALLVGRGGEPAPDYRKRMEELFPFRDGRCCERVYDAVASLESPEYFAAGPAPDRMDRMTPCT